MMNKTVSRKPMREQILDMAENGYRQGGYAALSYRDIAALLGIKSASVHYHFAHKEDLGQAVVERYTNNFLAGLGAPDTHDENPLQRLERLTIAYQNAYQDSGSSCLCAVMGAVSSELPKQVQTAVSLFFQRLLNWTDRALGHGKANAISPAHIISALQGAMIMSVATGDAKHLDRIAEELLTAARERG
ncbi:TetR/AcrR family transcriptional regulator [Sphingorhabdus sp. Alg239-R122]|uniref:TetR/AcrR family transcriptional regulator n=1 Tax=Sphingorhabdus sp. Alg239-R122 TaxID=2305989 RepID=UPI0013DC3AD9|nr:TetR/AcrR family transcriptional regulator [Sphingorhabdus sp. Alg239-R122]